MTRKTLAHAAVAVMVLMAGVAHAQSVRDQIRIVGSSTVYPFATAVAEQFGKTTLFKVPVVEATGSGGGFKLFCAGIGWAYPDITNASRRIKTSEVETCARNGVTDIVEVKIGYDGIVLAHAKTSPPLQMTRRQIFLALAKQVPQEGRLIDNPYHTWQDVEASLPDVRIEVLGPPPTSGTRDAFVELIMETACEGLPEFMALKKEDPRQFQMACQMIREDGAFIEAGENDNLIVQKLVANPRAFGIFGFSFLDQNIDRLHGVAVDSQEPTFDNIADGHYPVSRPLYFYVKKAHGEIVPGLKEYVAAFASEKAWGREGHLADKGLIPLSDAERQEMREQAVNMTNFNFKE
ncbi:MAG: phosphate transport system substrate-binding protein [Rhodospirillaceae bacterium]|nr:MAG: phosphate transport system substrate-binding protein [Rhodospirillaceae bacterium]